MLNPSAWRSNEAEMSESHLAYLSLGSNIQPEVHLVRAIQRLQDYSKIERLSSAWESKSVGAEGPNYLNACASMQTLLNQTGLKQQILLPLELELGRRRSENKFAPRTIDIDIVLFDDRSCDNKFWEQAFVVVPLAEIYPTYQNPLTHEPIVETAARLRTKVWMEAQRAVFDSLGRNETSI